ncbi:MAG: tRNA pseudouridine(55) synthase TruB [Bacteroidia bacterium]
MKTYDFINGEVILINKPLRWTSFDVVNKLKWAIKRRGNWQEAILSGSGSSSGSSQSEDGSLKLEEQTNKQQTTNNKLKVGHAGTLDPLATGLLIICTGKKTKEIESYQAQEKEYTGTFFLGATTPCFDLEKEPDTFFPTNHITDEMIYETTKQFTGKILQAPPAHSAVMIEGKRAYELARAGNAPEMKQKEVNIYEFEITAIEMPLVKFRVVCSKGTYIRSLANDFGLALNSGAYLAELCRTRIGNFLLKDALGVEAFLETLASA